MTETGTSTYASTHELHGKLLSFELGAEAVALNESAELAKSGRTAKTLVKEGTLRVTLVAIRKGASLESHQVAGPVSIQALSGSLKLTTDAGTVDLSAGSLVVLGAGVTHSAEAIEDCTLLLTLTIPAAAA